MQDCIICGQIDCPTIHTHEEIKAASADNICYICRKPDCITEHTIEEIRNPVAPSPEEFGRMLRILVAYDKLLKHGDDQASTE